MRFSDLIKERCAALNIASQAELGRLLTKRGVSASANTLSSWHTGSKRPRLGRLAALLDVLELHGADRDRAYRLANELEVGDDAPADATADVCGSADLPERLSDVA
jgi:hypothetical protein